MASGSGIKRHYGFGVMLLILLCEDVDDDDQQGPSPYTNCGATGATPVYQSPCNKGKARIQLGNRGQGLGPHVYN